MTLRPTACRSSARGGWPSSRATGSSAPAPPSLPLLRADPSVRL